MKGSVLDGFALLLFGVLASSGVAACIVLCAGNHLSSLGGAWLFADGFFCTLIGAAGYCFCLVRFINYLRQGMK